LNYTRLLLVFQEQKNYTTYKSNSPAKKSSINQIMICFLRDISQAFFLLFVVRYQLI